jgi:hypothetical protein
MAVYRVTTVGTTGTVTTEHDDQEVAYEHRVTPAERAGLAVRVEEDLFEDGQFRLFEDHNH